MYNEISGREFARNRMREAQQEAQNARILASLESKTSGEAGQSAANRLGNSFQQILEMLSLRRGLAGSK